MKQTFKIIFYTLLICILIYIVEIFYPRRYEVPLLKKRIATQYWNLSTGSRIGYTFIAAATPQKSYPVIYLHGGPGGHITDRDIKIFALLADRGYDVYLYDQIGSGQSKRLANIREYTVKRHIDDLEEISQRTDSKKVILIGQSWGGILAALFAARYPDKIEKIILSCPGPVYPIRKNLSNTQPHSSIHLKSPFYTNEQGNKKANNVRTKAIKFFATEFGEKIASDREADDFSTYLSYEVDKSTVCDTANILKKDAGSGFYAGIMTFNNLLKIEDPRPEISRLTIPVLVMKGECDNQKWGYTHEYLELCRNSELKIIPGAGHFISVEQPELYIKAMLDFLNK